MKLDGPLTRKQLRDWQPESRRDPYLWDGSVRGLGLRVVGGARAFVFRYRDTAGKQRLKTLGRVDELTYARAVEIAHELRVEITRARREGRVDPLTEGAARREDLRAEVAETRTVEALARVYQVRCGARKRERSRRYDEGRWQRHILPRLGAVAVADVTGEQVAALHDAMVSTPVAANRVLALLRHALGESIRWGWRQAPNPASGVSLYEERGRRRALTDDELGRLLRAIEWQYRSTRPGVDRSSLRARHRARKLLLYRLLLLTGARPEELVAARWEWVDLEARVLALPTAKSDHPGRAPRGRRIGLGKRTVEALTDLRTLAGTSPWLFPSPRKAGSPMRRDSIYGTWREVCALAQVDGVVPYLARHNWITRAARRAGVDLPALRDSAGHRSIVTTEGYLHTDVETARETADAVEEHLVEMESGARGPR